MLSVQRSKQRPVCLFFVRSRTPLQKNDKESARHWCWRRRNISSGRISLSLLTVNKFITVLLHEYHKGLSALRKLAWIMWRRMLGYYLGRMLRSRYSTIKTGGGYHQAEAHHLIWTAEMGIAVRMCRSLWHILNVYTGVSSRIESSVVVTVEKWKSTQHTAPIRRCCLVTHSYLVSV